MGRRDSPFRLHPRLALVPWLARFGAAALPARSTPPRARLRELAEQSLALHEALRKRACPTSFARRGILSVYERGGEPGMLSAAEARELEPALSPGLAGAVFHPDEAHCDPSAFVDALLAGAREHGAEIRTGVEILRLRRRNGSITGLDTTDGPARGRHRGSRRRDVDPRARARRRRARPARGRQGLPRRGRHRALRAGIPVYMEESRVIATPLGGRLRLAGTLELAGIDQRVDHVRLESLVRAARRTLVLPLRASTVKVWRGLRPCAPDGLPVIGRVAVSRTWFWPPRMRCSASRWRR